MCLDFATIGWSKRIMRKCAIFLTACVDQMIVPWGENRMGTMSSLLSPITRAWSSRSKLHSFKAPKTMEFVITSDPAIRSFLSLPSFDGFYHLTGSLWNNLPLGRGGNMERIQNRVVEDVNIPGTTLVWFQSYEFVIFLSLCFHLIFLKMSMHYNHGQFCTSTPGCCFLEAV